MFSPPVQTGGLFFAATGTAWPVTLWHPHRM